MSKTILISFIKVTDSFGNVMDRYQNSKRRNFNEFSNSSGEYLQPFDNFIILDGEEYYYLPFLYQGATKSRGGDNLEANLIFANNPISMNRARFAVVEKWTVEVFVCTANEYLNPVRTLTHDVWLASSMSYDPTQVEVLLSSGIDAVGSNAPNRVLTTGLCGHLPTTGQIQNR